ncbi:MAG: dockerin type I repeat-containing protein [Planctomycetota bacterium]
MSTRSPFFVLAALVLLILTRPVAAQPSVQIGGTLTFNLNHPVSWQVSSTSPTWVAVPLYGCTTTLVSILDFFNECTFEDEILRCTKTVCTFPVLADPFGGPSVTTTFSEECYYCIENPLCCGIGSVEFPVPGYQEIDSLRVGLDSDNTVPVDVLYSMMPPGPLMDLDHEAAVDVARALTFRFTRPPGASGAASLQIPFDIDSLVVRAWQGSPLSISNGFAHYELRAQSPQLGNLFRLRIEQPIDGPATILGTIPGSAYDHDLAESVLTDYAGSVAPIPVPASMNVVEITVTMTFLGEGSFDCDPFVRGDVNGDGMLNLGDIVSLLSYVFSSGAAPQPLEAGDLNGDGLVNVADAIYGLSFLFNGGPQPPAPYPTAGCP